MILKRLLALILVSAFVLSLFPVMSFADEDINVYFNGNKLNYKNKPYYDNGTLLIPFKETLESFGLTVDYNETLQKYQSVINEYEITAQKGTGMLEYDLIPFEFERKLKEAEDDVYMEAAFFDKVYDFATENRSNGFYIKGKINIKEEFDVEAYLASQPTKTYVISPESLFKSKISGKDLITKTEVEIKDLPGVTRGVELVNLTEPDIYYTTQITMTSESAITENDIIVAEFWAKKIKCIDESGLATFNVVLETLDGKYTKYINKTDTVGDWTHFRYAFKVPVDIPNKGSQVGFRIGFRLQTIQLADFSFINYGPALDMDKIGGGTFATSDYHGMEEDALWREEAFKRIEKHRVRDINVETVDKDGNPVSDVTVKADMTKSEFIWGTAVDYREMFSGRARANKFKEKLLENFNSIVLENGMKTATYNPRYVMDTLNYAANNDLYVRAHAILWDNTKYFPDVDPTKLTEKEAFDYMCRHASRVIYNIGPAVNELDAINEPLNNNYFQKKYGKQFAANVLKAVNDMVEDVNPDIDIFVNDIMCGLHSNWNNFIQSANLVKSYKELGGRVDGIGIQDHLINSEYPQDFYNQIDYLTDYVDKIAITEYDYISGYVNKSITDESVEAKQLKDTLIVAYSHPNVTGFTMWGFTDAAHWRSWAPLYYKTYLPKQEALGYWKEYVQDKWFTHTSAKTDKDGKAKMRGHRGDYNITIEKDGKEYTTTLVVSENGENKVVAVIDEANVVLTSSETASKPLEKDYLLNNMLKQEDAELAYLQLYNNRVTNVVDEEGKNIDFLKDEDNTSYYSLGEGKSIIVKLDESLKKGVVEITFNQKSGIGYILKVEGQDESGNWITLGNLDSVNSNVIRFDKNINAIKLTGIGKGIVQMSNIHVSKNQVIMK